MSQLVCQACGAPVTRWEPIPRDAECDKCHADLRACRNCRHWDSHYNNECKETEADPVSDKTRRNFCEFFDFARKPFAGAAGTAASGVDRAAEARAKLEALFRKKPTDDEASN